jgi:hypothetical protein
MVASKHPRRSRQINKVVNECPAVVQIVTIDPTHMGQSLLISKSQREAGDDLQAIMLKMTQYLTGNTMRAYEDNGWQTSWAR